jgi:hypothetical protein
MDRLMVETVVLVLPLAGAGWLVWQYYSAPFMDDAGRYADGDLRG